jgi:hypothetical protein
MSKFRKIDLHTHISPQITPNWNKEFGEEGWLTFETDADTDKVLIIKFLYNKLKKN